MKLVQQKSTENIERENGLERKKDIIIKIVPSSRYIFHLTNNNNTNNERFSSMIIRHDFFFQFQAYGGTTFAV